MDDERERQKEFMSMQLQMNKNQDMLSRERLELENIRRQFLDEMEHRMKNPRFVPSPPPEQKGKSSTFTYTYTDEVSIYEKGI